MRIVLALVLALAACDHGTRESPAIAPPAPPAPAPAPPPGAPIACGELTCTGTDVCIETTRSGGVAPPPGKNYTPGHSYRCAAAPDASCTTRDARHQECYQEIPRAAPH